MVNCIINFVKVIQEEILYPMIDFFLHYNYGYVDCSMSERADD